MCVVVLDVLLMLLCVFGSVCVVKASGARNKGAQQGSVKDLPLDLVVVGKAAE